MIYLDYAATTPMSKESIDIYAQVATSFYGNPTSLHDIGSSAEELLEKSRAELAEVLSCDPEGVYFTSGGSDANITALASEPPLDRKSTRLNSSHVAISYAVFCLKKKTKAKALLHVKNE